MTRPTTPKPKKAAVPVTQTGNIAQYRPGNIFSKAFDWTARLDLPGNHVRVLDFILRLCGRAGQTSCHHEFIASRLNISSKTVERAVGNIEARQLLAVRREYKKPNHYTVPPDILKAVWAGRGRLPNIANLDKVSVMLDSHVHKSCHNLSSAPADADARACTYKEEMLSASRVSEANGTVEEQKALIGEIVEIRNQLHESNPERYPKIISPKAYAGKLSTKSTPELKTELENNRKVLENSKKPKSVTGSASGQSIMAQANEIERTSFTGFNEPWFVAWSSLEEQDRIGWRERAEAQLWNDSGWDEWCRQHPDPVEQELGRRRATRNLFRFEWEQLQQYQRDMEEMGAAGPAGEVSVDRLDSQPEPIASQVTPADTDPDDDPPPSTSSPKARRHRTRRPATATTRPDSRKTSHQPASQTPGQNVANASTGILRGQSAGQQPGNVLLFRRPAPSGPFSGESLSPDERPPTRGPDDG